MDCALFVSVGGDFGFTWNSGFDGDDTGSKKTMLDYQGMLRQTFTVLQTGVEEIVKIRGYVWMYGEVLSYV